MKLFDALGGRITDLHLRIEHQQHLRHAAEEEMARAGAEIAELELEATETAAALNFLRYQGFRTERNSDGITVSIHPPTSEQPLDIEQLQQDGAQ